MEKMTKGMEKINQDWEEDLSIDAVNKQRLAGFNLTNLAFGGSVKK